MSLVTASEHDRAQTESRKGNVVYSPLFDPGCEVEVAWNGTLQRVIVPYAEADRVKGCLE